jgi:hypothetical protein
MWKPIETLSKDREGRFMAWNGAAKLVQIISADGSLYEPDGARIFRATHWAELPDGPA